MERIIRTYTAAGAVLGLAAVAMGAFGAHALADHLAMNGRAATYDLAARYQMYHALALLAMGWATGGRPVWLGRLAGGCFVVGTVIFSGSLYVLALSNVGGWGAVTPLGGLTLIVGWFALLVMLLNYRHDDSRTDR